LGGVGRPSYLKGMEKPLVRQDGQEQSVTSIGVPSIVGLARGPSLALAGILLLLVIYTLYFAQSVIVPVVIAAVLNLVLGPVVTKLRRWGIPEPLGAAIIVVVVLGAIGWFFYALSGPALEWFDRAPNGFREIEAKLGRLMEPVAEVRQTAERVEQLAKGSNGDREVAIRTFSISEFFVVSITTLSLQIGIVVVLVYFFLASGDLFLRRFVKALSTGSEKRRAVEIAHRAQHEISIYLLTVTIINSGLGLLTTLAMWLVGLPNAGLWGVMAALFNFIPYIGPAIVCAVLGAVGMASFDGVGQAFLAPGIFLLLHGLESNLISPAALGRRFAFGPAILFLSLIGWSWLWGIAGALLAVPLLVTIRIIADNVRCLAGVAIFLGRED
jgi:predicted PurR-regulated permease PerM